jgi:uncharacterized protein (TIGR02246 family)
VAINNNDAAGVAAAFTEDGVLVAQEGPSFGRAAIQKFYEDLFQKVHFSNNVTTVDENSPHVIGSDGKAVWATGAWSATIKGEGFGPIDIKGYWSAIRGARIGRSGCSPRTLRQHRLQRSETFRENKAVNKAINPADGGAAYSLKSSFN